MNLPRTLLSKSTAALQLCYLLVRRISTAKFAVCCDGGSANLGRSASQEYDTREQTFIDYSVLPVRKKKTEYEHKEDLSHHKLQDVPRKEISESVLTNSMVPFAFEA